MMSTSSMSAHLADRELVAAHDRHELTVSAFRIGGIEPQPVKRLERLLEAPVWVD